MDEFQQLLIVLGLGVLALVWVLLREEKRPRPVSLDSDVRKKFTAGEVAPHKTKSDCWIIVEKKVYDVTSYIEEHPGGDYILRNAGKDSTAGFRGPQHPESVDDVIKNFYIGDLI